MTEFSKIKISGVLLLESGLHIGGSSAFAAIGAIDSPIIKDPLTNLPIIPGSSLKGKMRSLLAKAYNESPARNPHEDNEKIRRLFGDSQSDENEGFKTGRLIFRDSVLSNVDELENKGARTLTETKFENTIDRYTAEANPRQIERAIKGSKFSFELIYELDNPTQSNEDIEVILSGLKLLEIDYLGGSGSRGYGKIKFNDLKAETVFGNFDSTDINGQINKEAIDV
jgi:CRISPR-associated protein Csm3